MIVLLLMIQYLLTFILSVTLQEFATSGQVDKDGNLLFVYEFDVIESL